MEWATSSSVRWARNVVVCLAITSLPVVASAQASWEEIHQLIAEGLYLESALGDYAAATNLYERGLEREGLEPEQQAELMFRAASGHERLGDPVLATQLFEALLDDHAAEEPWADLAHQKLLHLAERERQIGRIPHTLSFDDGADAWLHSGGYQRRRGLEWTDEVGHAAPGAVVWQSWVLTQARDEVYLAFTSPSPPLHSVELWIRAIDFPAHLILFLVEEGGSRFASGLYVIEPAEGWVRIRSSLDDFFLFPGEDVTRHPRPQHVEFLLLEDATATYSTDRGINRILLDDVRLE